MNTSVRRVRVKDDNWHVIGRVIVSPGVGRLWYAVCSARMEKCLENPEDILDEEAEVVNGRLRIFAKLVNGQEYASLDVPDRQWEWLS